MPTYPSKFAALAVAFACGVGMVSAQTTLSGDHTITGDLNVGTSGAKGILQVTGETGGSAAPGIKVTGDGGVVFGGTLGTGQIPATGDGVRFMWYPKKAALRAGEAWGGNWDDTNIGDASVAFASGEAIGDYSFAFGGSATGEGAATIHGVASGYVSVALSFGFAAGDYSLAVGEYSVALANSSVAIHGDATGEGSFTFGGGSQGEDSVSLLGIAFADESIAIGRGALAESYGSVVVGRYNAVTGTESPDSWVENDPLFVVGNGTGVYSDPPELENRNAFTIYKNGNVHIPKRQGDILMGEFGNPE